jgi:5'-nucleotidase
MPAEKFRSLDGFPRRMLHLTTKGERAVHALITNDDGIEAENLWTLAGELRKLGRVTVAAPEQERSAIGTAVTLLQPLHAEEYHSPIDGVTAYAIDGTPSDCVILALGALAEDVDIVLSGINRGTNVGEDVHISGTVGGALQGYFRGLPALAVSASPGSTEGARTAAVIAARLAGEMTTARPKRVFLNVNAPARSLDEITEVRVTRLARASHINTVNETESGPRRQFRMVRSRLPDTDQAGTDIEALEAGAVSITALYTSLLDKPPQRILKKICADLTRELTGRA